MAGAWESLASSHPRTKTDVTNDAETWCWKEILFSIVSWVTSTKWFTLVSGNKPICQLWVKFPHSFYSPKYLHGLCILKVPSLLRYANCVQLTKEKGPLPSILFRAQMFCSSAFLSTSYMSGSKHGIVHYSKSSCTGGGKKVVLKNFYSNQKWKLVAQSCPTLCDPMVCSQAPLSLEFSRHEYWSGLPFPSPGDLSNPGIKPRFPTLQADSLPTELITTREKIWLGYYLIFFMI